MVKVSKIKRNDPYSMLEQAYTQRNHLEAVRYALQCLRQSTTDNRENRKNILKVLSHVVFEASKNEPKSDLLDRIRNQVQSFAHTFLPNEFKTYLSKFDISEKASWLFILNTLFSQAFFKEILFLSEEVLAQHPQWEVRGEAAAIYLFTARRYHRFTFGQMDLQKVREKAEFLLKNFPSMISHRQGGWDDESFYTFLVDLGCFGLFDLQERALELRALPKEDLAWLYYRLNRKLSEKVELNELSQEVSRVKEILRSKYRYDSVLVNELAIVLVKILRTCLEKAKREITEVQPEELEKLIDLMENETWLKNLLLEPRSNLLELSKKFESYLQRTLAIFKDIINKRAYHYLEVSPLPGFSFKEVYIVFCPEEKAIEFYFQSPDGEGCFKVSYPIQKDERGRFVSIIPRPSIGGKVSSQVPLFWDYVSLLAVFGSGLLNFDVIRKTFEETHVLLKQAAFSLYVKNAAQAFYDFQKVFQENPNFLKLLLDVESRYRTCLEIIRRFKIEPQTGVYELEPSDFLYELISKIEIIEREKVASLLAEFGGNNFLANGQRDFLLGVICKTKDGKEFLAILKDWERLEILGGKPDENIALYLMELFLEVLVKKSSPKEGRVGYVVEVKASDLDFDIYHKGLVHLEEIYRSKFYEQLEEGGLLSLPWFYRKGELFHPSEADSPEKKQQLLKEKPPHEIFVQVEPNGKIVRLPLRLKRNKEGELELSPWVRNVLREEQQKLLGDSRPLPNYYALYIITTFDNQSQHVYLHSLAKTLEEALNDKLLTALEEELRKGIYRNPEILCRYDKKEKREKLIALIKEEKIRIVEQVLEVFEVQTTFRRPRMVSLAQLLAQGYKL
jgi:hypothetical protein